MGSLLSNFKVRGYGSGSAANIYEAMPALDFRRLMSDI